MEGLEEEKTGGVSWSLGIQLLLDLTSKSSRLLDLTSRSSPKEGADAKEEELSLREESEGLQGSTSSSAVLSSSRRG